MPSWCIESCISMQSAPKIGNDDLLKRWLNPWNARFAGVLVSADLELRDLSGARTRTRTRTRSRKQITIHRQHPIFHTSFNHPRLIVLTRCTEGDEQGQEVFVRRMRALGRGCVLPVVQ
jgi:hypothetical protein